MKEITRLVNEWDTFEAANSDATIAEFCRYYLSKEKQQNAKAGLFGGNLPPQMNSTLGKLISHLASINAYYFKNGMKDSRELDLDSFSIMNAIFFKGEARKTEIIYESFLEVSTGIDNINRLIARNLISERPDPADKRARLIKLTPEGEKRLHACRVDAAKIAEFMYGNIGADDKEIIFYLLSRVDMAHSRVIAENKGQDIWELVNNSVAVKDNSDT